MRGASPTEQKGTQTRGLSWSGELHNIGWTYNAEPAAIENVRVDLSCPNISMAEKFLNRADIVAGFKELSREAVAE